MFVLPIWLLLVSYGLFHGYIAMLITVLCIHITFEAVSSMQAVQLAQLYA